MHIYSNTKLYIVSPYHKTGGPRSLHQLAQMAREKGIKAFIVYYNRDEFCANVNCLYKDCDVAVTDLVEDNSENVIIVPEIATHILRKFNYIQRTIWWLSLDFYLNSDLDNLTRSLLLRKGLPTIFYPLIYVKRGFQRFRDGYYKPAHITDIDDLKKIYHLYNCEYVKIYLQSLNVPTSAMHYLCGPIESYFKGIDRSSIRKESIVSYNPAKVDRKFMQLIIRDVNNRKPDISFVGIENMSREKVVETLSSSSVYIDLGFFPGPERMPREAVCLFCNIITSKLGSAENDEDVPIPNEFKFAIKRRNVALIADMIIAMTEQYNDYVAYFDKYRKKVYHQIDNFHSDIDEILNIEMENSRRNKNE